MISSKYSTRRHVTQRPPICNPPLKRIQNIPVPPWPPGPIRAQGSITYAGQSRSIDVTINPTFPFPGMQAYNAQSNQITISARIATQGPSIAIDTYQTTIQGETITASQAGRPLNPAIPINETYPPWTSLYPYNAQATLTITNA